MLERDVRYLDSRIALLIQNVRAHAYKQPLLGSDRGLQRMALDEREEVREHLEEAEEGSAYELDDKKTQVSAS